jgi:WD40 repeat protein
MALKASELKVGDTREVVLVDDLTRTLAIVRFTADPNTVVTAGADTKLRFWNATNGRVIDTVAYKAPVVDLATTDDGRQLRAAIDPGTVYVLDDCFFCRTEAQLLSDLKDTVGDFELSEEEKATYRIND